jgi:hypothetical protein
MSDPSPSPVAPVRWRRPPSPPSCSTFSTQRTPPGPAHPPAAFRPRGSNSEPPPPSPGSTRQSPPLADSQGGRPPFDPPPTVMPRGGDPPSTPRRCWSCDGRVFGRGCGGARVGCCHVPNVVRSTFCVVPSQPPASGLMLPASGLVLLTPQGGRPPCDPDLRSGQRSTGWSCASPARVGMGSPRMAAAACSTARMIPT